MINKNDFDAKVLADSVNVNTGERLTTMVVTFPRMVLAEFNTHRVFSRNSASSRAIPAQKMIERVKETPFVPLKFQASHSGMQGTEYLTGEKEAKARRLWYAARNKAVSSAEAMLEVDVTKQIVNRILEPYLYHTVIVTATDWANFFNLRAPHYEIEPGMRAFSEREVERMVNELNSDKEEKEIFEISNYPNISQAEIHIQKAAELMYEALITSEPTPIKYGDWHMPFVEDITDDEIIEQLGLQDRYFIEGTFLNDVRRKISVARCARVSYNTFDGEFSIEKDIALYNRLASSGHWSPFEHVAMASPSVQAGNFRGYKQLRHIVDGNY